MDVERAIQLVKNCQSVKGGTVAEYFERWQIPASHDIAWRATLTETGQVLVEYVRNVAELSPVHYRWIVDGDQVVAINGKAKEVTPQLAAPMTEEEYHAEREKALGRLLEELHRIKEGRQTH